MDVLTLRPYAEEICLIDNPVSRQSKVAYFCMEYGLHEDFRIYSGGLGILAGDLLKAAKDKDYPLVAIGILWRQGYTKQVIDDEGRVCDCYPEYRYDFLKDTGVTVKVRIRGKQVKCKVWLCDKFGNVPLYLLDTNLPDNPDSLITGQLYGWFSEERIAQEIVLGVGGVRALRKLGIEPDVYHFNEGHAVFAGIELLREKMDNEGLTFEQAWDEVRKKIVFTTHTPVKEGNETHDHDLLSYMGANNGLTYGQMLKLGGEPFNMTIAGLRLSRKANAVAKLHGITARNMWKDVTNSSEIVDVTNGVHNGSWQDERIVSAYREAKDLWLAHMEVKREMIDEVYVRNGIRLKETVLTIGFARRAAPYKRSDLIFKNIEVIEPLLKGGIFQIVFSGKAHPNDLRGKEIVLTLHDMSKRYQENVIFIQNYDMKIGRVLTRGCDVWLNNPIRPMEASGTSGMKAAMNGVLNLSVLDGWWPEGCVHGVNGWQIGSGYEGEDCDQIDSESLYDILLKEVIPMFYENRPKWVEMMRASIEMSQFKFSAARMLEDYHDLLYSNTIMKT